MLIVLPGTPLLVEDNKKSSPNIPMMAGTGLPAMYRRYCIRLYAFISKPKRSKREYIPMALREDIAKLDRYIAQMDFLYQHRIEDRVTLESPVPHHISSGQPSGSPDLLCYLYDRYRDISFYREKLQTA